MHHVLNPILNYQIPKIHSHLPIVNPDHVSYRTPNPFTCFRGPSHLFLFPPPGISYSCVSSPIPFSSTHILQAILPFYLSRRHPIDLFPILHIYLTPTYLSIIKSLSTAVLSYYPSLATPISFLYTLMSLSNPTAILYTRIIYQWTSAYTLPLFPTPYDLHPAAHPFHPYLHSQPTSHLSSIIIPTTCNPSYIHHP